MARLPRLIGRGRALEVLLGADDIDGELAERYGYVNRTLPDAEIEAFVDALAQRLASFEKHALVGAKTLMNDVTLPPDTVLPSALTAFFTSVAHPGARARSAALLERGLQRRSDVERRLGKAVADYRD